MWGGGGEVGRRERGGGVKGKEWVGKEWIKEGGRKDIDIKEVKWFRGKREPG